MTIVCERECFLLFSMENGSHMTLMVSAPIISNIKKEISTEDRYLRQIQGVRCEN